jgi:hypothetical protein
LCEYQHIFNAFAHTIYAPISLDFGEGGGVV